MTDDIVKRLHLPWPDDATVEEVTLPVWVLDLMGEGAREITALRAEVERLERHLALADDAAREWRQHCLAAEAERDRLREALRELIDHTHNCERELTEGLHHVDFCGESLPLTKARAALTTKGDADDRA